MSNYSIVPNAALAATADAIKAKLGSQNDLEWGQDGFATYITNISLLEDVFKDNKLCSGDIVYNAEEINRISFQGRPITGFTAPNLKKSPYGLSIGTYYGIFYGCTSLVFLDAPKWTNPGDGHNYGCTNLAWFKLPCAKYAGAYGFQNCTALQYAIMPRANILYTSAFSGCTNLKAFDGGGEAKETSSLGLQRNTIFSGCTKLDTMVIRKADAIWELTNINVFQNTPFASDGTGGTLYVPSSLISNYESATNWATILGYANNQIKSIESTHTDPNADIDLTLYYADGTLIPTLSSIHATCIENSDICVTDTLASIKNNLVVTAIYSDSTSFTLSNEEYTLSGTLVAGTSTITVTHKEITTTVNIPVNNTSWDYYWNSSLGAATDNGWTSSKGSLVDDYWVLTPTTSDISNIRKTTDFTAANGIMEMVVRWDTLPLSSTQGCFFNLPKLRYIILGNTVLFTVNTSDTTTVVYTGLKESVDIKFKIIYSATTGCSLYIDGTLVHEFTSALPYDTTRFLIAENKNTAPMYIKSIRLKATT